MKRLFVADLALALLVPGRALARSPFDGTWKTDVRSMKGTGRPAKIDLRDGLFECNCVPPIRIKADGADHTVAGHSGFDTVAVAVTDDHGFRQTSKRSGVTVQTMTFTVAADGYTATVESADTSSGSGAVMATLVLERVPLGAAGPNAATGTWRFKRFEGISDDALTSTYRVEGAEVKFSNSSGDSYAAQIGGKAVPYTDGSGATGTTVAVERQGNDTLHETFYRDGRIASWTTMTVLTDGKTMKTVSHNVRTDRSMSALASRQ